MTNIFSVQYQAKGEKEFILPFSIIDVEEVIVWVNNSLQSQDNYQIQLFTTKLDNLSSTELQQIPYFGKIVFQSTIGTVNNPQIVTIEKSFIIERKTNFQEFTNFRANYLNIEFNNLFSILQCLQQKVNKSVRKSNLEDQKTILLFPQAMEGKGIYWGKNGELLNTEQNLNDVLNELDNLKIIINNLSNSKIVANEISLNTHNTGITHQGTQDVLQLMDINIGELKNQQEQIKHNIANNTHNLDTINIQMENKVFPELSETQKNINNLQNEINSINQNLTSLLNNNINTHSYDIYSVVRSEISNEQNLQYLVNNEKLKTFNLFNISPNNPLIFNFAYKGKNIQFVVDNYSQFLYSYFHIPTYYHGRLYIVAEIKNEKIFLKSTINKPYFSYLKPTKTTLDFQGENKDLYYCFVVKELTFYRISSVKPTIPLPLMYLGYYDLDKNGNVISEITYFNNGKTFEYYLDITVNKTYVIPNYLGCDYITLEIYIIDEKGFYIPIYYHNRLNEVFEIGIFCSFSFDQINLHTGFKGIYGYYENQQYILSQSAKIKIIVTRKF